MSGYGRYLRKKWTLFRLADHLLNQVVVSCCRLLITAASTSTCWTTPWYPDDVC